MKRGRCEEEDEPREPRGPNIDDGDGDGDDDNLSAPPLVSDVESAIHVILSRIPLNTNYPKIIMKHQLLPIIHNQTEVMSSLISLWTTI